MAVLGWQPIETAPKDGTNFLSFYPETGATFIAFFAKGRFFNLWSGEDRSDEQAITHWQPTPAAHETTNECVTLRNCAFHWGQAGIGYITTPEQDTPREKVIALIAAKRAIYEAKRDLRSPLDDNDTNRWEVYDFAVEVCDYLKADILALLTEKGESYD
jgi:hypothetical protein